MADRFVTINGSVKLPLSEIEMTAIRSQGPGGQNVNKVASAIHLRFDVESSSLSDWHKMRIFSIRDRRINAHGVIVIKAQSSRTQAQNKVEALERLREILQKAFAVQKTRRPTKPSRGSVRRRLDQKTRRSGIKSLRRKPGARDE